MGPRGVLATMREQRAAVLEVGEEAGRGQTQGDITDCQVERRHWPAGGHHAGHQGQGQQYGAQQVIQYRLSPPPQMDVHCKSYLLSNL